MTKLHDRPVSDAEALDLLRGLVRWGRTRTDIARELKVSPSFVSQVMLGQKRPTDEMLALVGVRRVTRLFKTEFDE